MLKRFELMPQIESTARLLKDGAFPAKHDGRPHNIPNLATVSLLIWSLALARKCVIRRGFNTNHFTIEYVGVDHCGFCIAMSNQLLGRTYSIASLRVVGGKRMA